MNTTLAKRCTDYFRSLYSTDSEKLKATHAHELFAALCGYKKHETLKMEKHYPIDNLSEATLFVPDIEQIESRRKVLKNLLPTLPESKAIATDLVHFLEREKLFFGEAPIENSLGEYVIDSLLNKEEALIHDQLAGIMAETNAYFDDSYYEDAQVVDVGDSIIVYVTGSLSGQSDPERAYWGDKIDVKVEVIFSKIAGQRGFTDIDISAKGEVNHDDVDPELKYNKPPTMRAKDQIIEMTGGYRLGESQEQFQQRVKEIQSIEDLLIAGKANVNHIERLATLRGQDDDEFDPVY